MLPVHNCLGYGSNFIFSLIQSETFNNCIQLVKANLIQKRGDTVIGKGYVTDKYINDKGEDIIDLVCWAETPDKGKIIEVCPAAAKPPLKKG